MSGVLTKLMLAMRIQERLSEVCLPRKRLTAQALEPVIDAVFAIILEHLDEGGEPVIIRGFGRFKISKIKPRSIYNFNRKGLAPVGETRKLVYVMPASVLKRLNN